MEALGPGKTFKENTERGAESRALCGETQMRRITGGRGCSEAWSCDGKTHRGPARVCVSVCV